MIYGTACVILLFLERNWNYQKSSGKKEKLNANECYDYFYKTSWGPIVPYREAYIVAEKVRWMHPFGG